jgi:hypothetical protein
MKHLVLRCCLACCALSIGITNAADKPWREDLGRLFIAPEKRALLDELRRNNARMSPASEQPESVRLDGIVRRSNGKQTMWINGQAYSGDAPVTSNDERSAHIITGSSKGVRLKVGESATLRSPAPAEAQP